MSAIAKLLEWIGWRERGDVSILPDERFRLAENAIAELAGRVAKLGQRVAALEVAVVKTAPAQYVEPPRYAGGGGIDDLPSGWRGWPEFLAFIRGARIAEARSALGRLTDEALAREFADWHFRGRP